MLYWNKAEKKVRFSSMKTIQIRNITIGEGRPKICVPVVGQTEEDILREAAGLASLPADVV